jgi:mono/diheme cytochrome c family protein
LNDPYRESSENKKVTTRQGWWADWAKIWGDLSDANQRPDKVDYLGSTQIEPKSPYAKYKATEYRGMCTELCGKGHWDMYFRTVAMSQQSFEQWKEDVQSGSGEVDGAKLYANNCATCHGQEGKGVGDSYPPLTGTKWTDEDNKESKTRHVKAVLSGLKGKIQVKGKTYDGVMQPWHSQYNDKEVAAIINHERTSWGNSGGKVDPKFVAKVRKEEGHPPRPGGSGPEPTPTDELMETGSDVYQSCKGCHGADGVNGSDMPNLKDNPKVLADPKSLVEILVKGQDTDKWPGKQPPMGENMTDKDIASVLTYIRKSWTNDASAVQPQEVREIRSKLNGK